MLKQSNYSLPLLSVDPSPCGEGKGGGERLQNKEHGSGYLWSEKACFFMLKQVLNNPNSKGVWPYAPTYQQMLLIRQHFPHSQANRTPGW